MTGHASKPHVLILVENLPVPLDRRVWMEATTLQSHGYQVHVVCPSTEQHPSRFELIDGIHIHRFPLPIEGRGALGTLTEYAWAIAWMSFLTIRISLKFPLKVVQICNPPDILFIPALFARWIRRSRIIFDQHDLCPELWEAKGHSETDLLGRALLAAESVTFRVADAVISTNESYREVAETRGRKAPESVTVVRSAPRRAFAIDELQPTRPAEEASKLAYLGTMGSQEGIDLLLEAVGVLKQELGHPNIRLDLVGSGPERNSLESLAAASGLSGHVRFHGRLPDQEMRSVLAAADIGVNPDRPSRLNNLSTMNKIIEYMALGLPIVQFECIEGRRSALESSAYVAEPTGRALAHAIDGLLRDSTEREKMRRFGHERFMNDLCWERQEGALLRAYGSA